MAPELPVTADRPAIQPARKRRLFGVRLWLALMFAAVGILTGTSVYLFVSGSSESAAENRSADLAAGRTFRLQTRVERALPDERLTKANAPADVLRDTRPSDSFRTWIYNTPYQGTGAEVVTPRIVAGLDIGTIPGTRQAVQAALQQGEDIVESDLPEGRTLVAVPLFGPGGKQGVLISVSERPLEVQSALDALRGQRLTALVVSVIVAGLVGFVVSTLIPVASSGSPAAAEQMAAGHFDAPLHAGGRDEIGDLGRALDTMRDRARARASTCSRPSATASRRSSTRCTRP